MSIKDIRRRRSHALRHVPTRDGSVLAWPLSSFDDNARRDFKTAILADPHDEEDPYDVIGGESG